MSAWKKEGLDSILTWQQHKACRTRELSAEQKFTRDHWRKQVHSMCGDILKVFVHACHSYPAHVNKNFQNVAALGGTYLHKWSRVNFCLADSSRVRQALKACTL